MLELLQEKRERQRLLAAPQIPLSPVLPSSQGDSTSQLLALRCGQWLSDGQWNRSKSDVCPFAGPETLLGVLLHILLPWADLMQVQGEMLEESTATWWGQLDSDWQNEGKFPGHPSEHLAQGCPVNKKKTSIVQSNYTLGSTCYSSLVYHN